MVKKYKKTNRRWLNPVNSEDTGAVQWGVYCDDAYYVSADFSIWDCSRKISLTFGVYNQKDAVQRAKKIDALIEELKEFKASIGEAYNIFNEYQGTKEGDDEY